MSMTLVSLLLVPLVLVILLELIFLPLCLAFILLVGAIGYVVSNFTTLTHCLFLFLFLYLSPKFFLYWLPPFMILLKLLMNMAIFWSSLWHPRFREPTKHCIIPWIGSRYNLTHT